MNAELSLAHLVGQASVLVQVVMAMLLLASVLSWAVILGKRSGRVARALDEDSRRAAGCR